MINQFTVHYITSCTRYNSRKNREYIRTSNDIINLTEWPWCFRWQRATEDHRRSQKFGNEYIFDPNFWNFAKIQIRIAIDTVITVMFADWSESLDSEWGGVSLGGDTVSITISVNDRHMEIVCPLKNGLWSDETHTSPECFEWTIDIDDRRCRFNQWQWVRLENWWRIRNRNMRRIDAIVTARGCPWLDSDALRHRVNHEKWSWNEEQPDLKALKACSTRKMDRRRWTFHS